MNINITHYHFEQIYKAGYTLDIIYLLKLVEEGFDVTSLSDDPKINMLCQTVRRKGLLTEEFKMTTVGKAILGFLDEEGEPDKKFVKKRQSSEAFDLWWKAYPGTDTFTHAGKDFTGTRSLRAKKDDCKIKLNSILAEGEYTITEMIAALEYEVLQKKENSIVNKTNKLSFMQNTLTYLNQRTFEPFIELIKDGKKIVETQPVKGIDI